MLDADTARRIDAAPGADVRLARADGSTTTALPVLAALSLTTLTGLTGILPARRVVRLTAVAAMQTT
ncbi:hypothetical protein [Kitasatospora aureofaciens]|uniref:hypothetical protein n=1 Tax=Kitasatospora aureofaciens TaxID=1894 RepID=UPI00381FD17A|nr:hypothetical protein [Kitasatospora aureofaciens]